MDNFLTPMRIPRLEDPAFQSQFDNFCRAIRDNFDKIISVQYTKGERGSSIINGKARVCDDNQKVTKLGATFLNGIFMPPETQPFTPGMTKDEAQVLVRSLAPQLVTGGRDAIDFNDFLTLELDIFVDTEGGLCYASTPYIFIDNRIRDLANLFRYNIEIETNELYRTFTDFSCSFTGQAAYYVDDEASADNVTDYANWEWSGIVSQIVPKLYFDKEIKEFCWKVNGQETHITAQGIKGEAGSSSLCHICKGTLSTNGEYINIVSAEYLKKDGGIPTQYWHQFNSNTDDAEYNAFNVIKDKDFVLCYYDEPIQSNGEPVGTRRRAFLGQAIEFNPDDKKLYRGPRPAGQNTEQYPAEDIFFSIANQSLKNLLYTIGPWNDPQRPSGPTENAIRGLFIKGYNTDNNNNVHHMLYAWLDTTETGDSGKKLRITPVTNQFLDWGETPQPYPHQDVITVEGHLIDFIIDYNLYVSGDVNLENLWVRGNANIAQNFNVQGFTQLQGNVRVQGSEIVQGNLLVQGNTNLQGNTVVNNLTVQGVFNQTGIIGTSLGIQGDFVQSVDRQVWTNSSSKFVRSCVSEINNIKTYVSAVKLKTNASEAGGRPEGDDSFPDIPLTIPQNSDATHLAYIGITFNLRLIIGYAGFGQDITDKFSYRRIFGNPNEPSHRNNRVTPNYSNSVDVWQNMNLYNAREYNIPCYIYKQFLLKCTKQSGEGETPEYILKIANPDANDENKWQDDVFVLFSQTTNEIIFEGERFTPKICFDVLLTAKGVEGYEEEYDASDQNQEEESDEVTQAVFEKYKLGVIFYQGSVETEPDGGFWMGLNRIQNSVSQIMDSSMSCLYSTDGTSIQRFTPLLPYQVCEPSPLSATGKSYMITDQVNNLYAGIQGTLSLDDEIARKYCYESYIKEVALPRMCAIAAGILEMNTYKEHHVMLPSSGYDLYTYSNEYNETVARPQRYMSFFMTGRNATYDFNNNQLSLDWVPGSFKVYRLFKFHNMDVLDGNYNVYSKSLVDEDPHVQMIQRMIDKDQSKIGTTETKKYDEQHITDHWNDGDIFSATNQYSTK